MGSEFQRGECFPSAKIRLRIRFEEYNPTTLSSKAPTKPTPRIVGLNDPRSKLPVQKVTDPNGTVRFEVQDVSGPSTSAPASQAAASSDLKTFVVQGIIPIEATWRQNGLRKGDSLDFRVRWSDFPFDPRVVRACAVEFFLGTIKKSNYIAGLQNAAGGTQTAHQEPLRLVPDSYVDDFGQQRTNLRFIGWADNIDGTLNDDDEPIVEFKCSDNTRLLDKQEAPPKAPLNTKMPVDEAIADYLAYFPQMAGISVEYRGTKVPTPRSEVPTFDVFHSAAFPPHLGPHPAGAGAGDDKLTVLDFLTDLTRAIGHNLRMVGNTLVVQRVSTIIGEKVAARVDDPYRPRQLESGRYPVRAMIYGRNLKDYKYGREYARGEPANIELRCYDPDTKRLLVARSPKSPKDRIVSALPGDGKADQKWTVKTISGVKNLTTLQTIADELYYARNKMEMKVNIETYDLWSFGGNNQDPDLLDMQVGDTLRVLVNRDSQYSTLTKVEKQLFVQGASSAFLQALGYPKNISDAYETAYTCSGFQRDFKARSLEYSWSIEEGVSVKGEFASYVVVRLENATGMAAVATTPATGS